MRTPFRSTWQNFNFQHIKETFKLQSLSPTPTYYGSCTLFLIPHCFACSSITKDKPVTSERAKTKFKTILRSLQWPGSNYYPPMKSWPCFTHMVRKSCTPKGSAAANAVTASALFAPRGPGQATPRHATCNIACGGSGRRKRSWPEDELQDFLPSPIFIQNSRFCSIQGGQISLPPNSLTHSSKLLSLQ